MYEAIIITGILMHFCSQMYEPEYVTFPPIPPLWKRLIDHAKQQYLLRRKYHWAYKSITIHIYP